MKKKIPLKITNTKYDFLTIFGTEDKFLKKIRKVFNVKSYFFNNKIILEGGKRNLEKAQLVIESIVEYVNKKGGIDEQEVCKIIDKIKAEAGNEKVIITPRGIIKPKTENQKEYMDAVDQNEVIIAIGPAGTGKTFLAVAKAVESLENKNIERIILTRPAVEAGESLGFLPGDMKEKVNPYLKPLYDALYSMLPGEKIKKYIENEVIEIAPLAYMRGRTFSDAFIILDEAQNTTSIQMKMFLTRLGWNSKAIVTGDVTQIDLKNNKESGLIKVQKILIEVKGIKIIYFDKKDVVRPKLVSVIIEAYEKIESV